MQALLNPSLLQEQRMLLTTVLSLQVRSALFLSRRERHTIHLAMVGTAYRCLTAVVCIVVSVTWKCLCVKLRLVLLLFLGFCFFYLMTEWKEGS